MLRRVNAALEKALYLLGGALFVVFIVVVLFQIGSRNLMPGTFVWTDEVAMFCFVWSVFLGAAVGLRRGVHYVVEILPQRFARANQALMLLALILCLPLIWVLAVNGWSYADMSWRRYSFSLGYPMFYQNVVVAIAGGAMALFAVELVLRCISVLRGNETDDHKAGDHKAGDHKAGDDNA